MVLVRRLCVFVPGWLLVLVVVGGRGCGPGHRWHVLDVGLYRFAVFDGVPVCFFSVRFRSLGVSTRWLVLSCPVGGIVDCRVAACLVGLPWCCFALSAAQSVWPVCRWLVVLGVVLLVLMRKVFGQSISCGGPCGC